MRLMKAATVLLIAGLVPSLVSCTEPTKPIKKLNIKRAADLEPIQSEASDTDPDVMPGTETEAEIAIDTATSTEALEIVEVQGFRGTCAGFFVGINAEDLITIRSSTEVRTYQLAGVSIPEDMRFFAQNDIRRWLDGKDVSVEIDESVRAIDPAVYLYVCPDGMMVNEELVRQGLAVPAQGVFGRSDKLKKASIEALTAGRGVWGRKTQ